MVKSTTLKHKDKENSNRGRIKYSPIFSGFLLANETKVTLYFYFLLCIFYRYGMGQVIMQSHGVWLSKCYPTPNHTKSELEAICRELGFLSGHAKEIKEMKSTIFNTSNNLVLEPFSDVILNNQTVIKMRNTNKPVARAVFDKDLKNCYPVFIECLWHVSKII